MKLITKTAVQRLLLARRSRNRIDKKVLGLAVSDWGGRRWRLKSPVSLPVLAFAICLCMGGWGYAESVPSKNRTVSSAPSEMERVLSKFVGIYSSPADATSVGIPDVPLMGNGDLAVAVGGEYGAQTFHLTKSNLCVGNRAAGHVRLTVEGTPNMPENYRQEQDILHAEVRSILPHSEGTLRVRSWTADSEDILVSELSLEKGATLNLSVEIKADKGAGVRGDVGWVCRERGPGKVAIACRILGAPSQVAISGAGDVKYRFVLNVGKTIQLVTVVAGGKEAKNCVEDAVTKAAGLTEETLVALHKDHLEWWNRYWSKSWIELNDELLEKYYYGALYVMGCASRANGVAPGLAGPWHVGPSLLWGNNYTMDYNFEAPWWGVYACNRAELADPHDKLFFEAVPKARELARKHGTKGLLLSVILEPGGGEDRGPLLGMKGVASLGAMNLISRYEYTQDEPFLLKAWPYLNELATFWENNLEWDESGLRWIVKNSACREIMGDHSTSFGTDTNPISDLSYIRRILGFLLRVGDRLEGKESEGVKIAISAERKQKWRDFLENLSPAPTTIFKGKIVFREAEKGTYYPDDRFCFLGPGDNSDVTMGVFPGEAVHLGSDPRLRQIARNTVEALNSKPNDQSWFQPNNFPKIFSQAVRTGVPSEEVVERLRQRLSNYNGRPETLKAVRSYMPSYKGEWLMNNLAINATGHAIESVGAIEAINSMLLQSADYVIRVFPGWIKGRDARFTNLRAKGGFLVSSQFKAGQVSGITIQSDAGQVLKLENPWVGAVPEICEIQGSKRTKLETKRMGEIYTFETVKGGRYEILPGERAFEMSEQKNEGDEVYVTITPCRNGTVRIANPWPLYGVKVFEISAEKAALASVRTEDGALCFEAKKNVRYKLVRQFQLASVELKADRMLCTPVTPVRLALSGRMSDGTAAPMERAQTTFASKDPGIATVDSTGAVVCLKPGIVRLAATATIDGASTDAELKLNVQPHQLKRVQIKPDKTVFAIGTGVELSVTGEMTDGSVANLEKAEIAFSSGDERIATVDSKGLVRFGDAGKVVFTATATLGGVSVSNTLELMVTDARIIQNITASDVGGSTPKRTVNGAGMSGLSLNATHDNDSTGGTMWSTHVRPGADATIRFDLGAVYKLDELWIWNHNQAWQEGKRGFRNVAIFHSLDGKAWTELKGPGYPYEFAQANGKPGLKATNLNDGQNTPVRFGGAVARFVKLVADPNPGVGSWGAEPYFGLSEVIFTKAKDQGKDH